MIRQMRVVKVERYVGRVVVEASGEAFETISIVVAADARPAVGDVVFVQVEIQPQAAGR